MKLDQIYVGNLLPLLSDPDALTWVRCAEHVYPNFGRQHQASLHCWCQPVPAPDGKVIWHNVLH